jgi:hypothetical protein
VSDLLGNGLPQFILDQSVMDEVLPSWWELNYEYGDALALERGFFVTPDGNYDNLIGDQDIDCVLLDESLYYEWPEITSGANGRYGFAGVTRDLYGSPLGGCVVKLFLTADDSKVDQVISDSLGNFLITTPFYPNTHYMVTYKAGIPDVTGATVNTLIGS